ncbi:protein transport protein sec24-like [Babesia caballi]|uniref:Protein transport protein sec24-like n=1 Tax=Babesia caballi TaxID=5871 RepID=A0AAV4M111_BABCB|nr:protein transport protein sec24-like [Babesia caballi]
MTSRDPRSSGGHARRPPKPPTRGAAGGESQGITSAPPLSHTFKYGKISAEDDNSNDPVVHEMPETTTVTRRHPAHHSHHSFNVPPSFISPRKNDRDPAQVTAVTFRHTESASFALRRASDASIDSLLSESHYVDKELVDVVYTYGKESPPKHLAGLVPRPEGINSLQNFSDNDGSGQPAVPREQTAPVDLRRCSEVFVASTMSAVPMFNQTMVRMNIPFAAVVQPFAQVFDRVVPEVDLVAAIGESDPSKQDLIRCPNCQAYFNPGMQGDARFDFRVCNICFKGFVLNEAESAAMQSLAAQTASQGSLPPILHGSVDFVAPRRYYNPSAEPPDAGTSPLSSLIKSASDISSRLPFIGDSTPKKGLAQSSYEFEDEFSRGFSGMLGNSTPSRGTNAADGEAPSPSASLLKPLVQRPKKGSAARTPGYVIVLDSTATSSKMGLKESVLNCIRAALEECIASGTAVRFCVITFDCVVHLYDRHNGVFTVNVVSDVSEPFSPGCVEELFFEFDGSNVDELAEYLGNISRVEIPPTDSMSCGNFALSVAISILADAGMPGTVCIFYAQVPEVGLGRCFKPEISHNFSIEESMKMAYDGMLQRCYEVGIAVDVYLCAPNERMPCDVPLQYVSQQTAGLCCYFSSYNGVEDAIKISKNLVRLFTVPHAYSCEMKLRCSNFIQVVGSYSPFNNARTFMDQQTLRLPRLSPDTAICFTLAMENVLPDKTELFLQLACMYNSSVDGRKLVRVHTHTIEVADNVSYIYKAIRCSVLVNYYGRKLAYHAIREGKDVREAVQNEWITLLSSYRAICAYKTDTNQMILPNNVKTLPAVLNSMFKIYGAEEKGAEFLQKLLRTLLAPPSETLFYHARCYCLHRSLYEENQTTPVGGWQFVCTLTPSATNKIFSDGIYLIDDGQKLVLYFGPHVRWGILQELFGQDLLLDESTVNSLRISESTETGRNLLAIVERVRESHAGGQYLKLKILAYCSRHHRLLKLLLLEDQFAGTSSYYEHLVFMHRRILQEYRDMVVQ